MTHLSQKSMPGESWSLFFWNKMQSILQTRHHVQQKPALWEFQLCDHLLTKIVFHPEWNTIIRRPIRISGTRCNAFVELDYERKFNDTNNICVIIIFLVTLDQQLFKNAVQFQSLSLNSYNPVFLCLTLITHYILFFLKSFWYCI